MKSAHALIRTGLRARESAVSPRGGILGERALTPKQIACRVYSGGVRCGSREYHRVEAKNKGHRGDRTVRRIETYRCKRCGAGWPMEETVTPTITTGHRCPWEQNMQTAIDIDRCSDALGSLEKRVLVAWWFAVPQRGQNQEIAVLWLLRETWPRVSWSRDRVRALCQSAVRKFEESALERLSGGVRA